MFELQSLLMEIYYLSTVNYLVNSNIAMYQDILNALKAKFTGVSDAVLSRIAKNLAKTATTAEQVKTAVDGVTLQQVIDGYADSRATEATQTAVHNYETKWGLKDGEKVDNTGGGLNNPNPNPQPPTGGNADQTPEWAKALLEQNKALSERIAKMEGVNITSTRRQQISTIVSKLPETLRKPYERISLETLSDEEFTTLVTDITTEVDGIASDINAKGAVFGRPSAKGGNQNENELTKEQQEAIAHRENAPVGGQGQPF